MTITLKFQTAAIALSLTTATTAIAQQQTLDDLFPRDRVVVVDIVVDPADWEKIRFESRGFIEALQPARRLAPIDHPYSWVEASARIDGVLYPKVGLRKKGFIGSADSERPSLKIKLDRFDSDANVEGLTTLTLNNNKQDQSQMSQFIGYELFNASGSPSPRCSLAHVTVNGHDLGVYSHVESMKAPLLTRSFGDASGPFFEGTVVDFYDGWTGSFERKSGDETSGRARIQALIDALGLPEGTALLGDNAVTRAWVPEHGRADRQWHRLGFNDRAWQSGTGGAGYERDSGYEELIGDGLDVLQTMNGKATSLYMRMEFVVDDIAAARKANNLLLLAHCDDGFVAYLNGNEVARHNAPDQLDWQSMATAPTDDGVAKQGIVFSLDGGPSLLRPGRNVLAVHLLNGNIKSSDCVFAGELILSDHDEHTAIWSHVDEESFFRFWAMEGLLSFWDGYSGNRNNFFVYLNPETDRFHFIPWGADCMFQKFSPLGVDPRSPRSVRVVGALAHRLYQSEVIREKYAKTMRSLLRDHWDERALLAETDRVELMVEPFLSDRQRSSVDFDSIREFIRNRRADVAPEVAGDMPLWSSVPGPPPVFGEMQNEKKGKDKNLAPLAFFADARDGKTAAVEAHLENGIDVDANDSGGGTALGIAALAGQLEVMQLLIQNGADVNHANPDKSRPLHGAAFFGESQAVELLLRADAEPNPLNMNMETPYDAASAAWSKELEGTIGFIATLVQVSADMTAIKTGRPKVLDVLRRYEGVPAAELSGPAQSSIWSAAKAGDLEAIKRLLSEGADADGHDPLGITPLSWAAIANQLEAVQLLIDLGASTAARNGDGETALHGASFLGNDEVVAVLLSVGAPVNARNAKGDTPLDGVLIPWSEQLQGIMTFAADFLKLKLDMEVVRAGRDRVATTLREHGAQLGETFR